MPFSDAIKQAQRVVGDTFGEMVSYLADGEGAAVSVPGVFSFAHVALKSSVANLEVSSEYPVLCVDLSDLPAAPRRGDVLTIRGDNYRIVESQPDGYGNTKLILMQVDA